MKVNDLYASTTAVIVRQLEEGVPPWVRPWKDDRMKGIGMMPSNLITGRLYSGSNVLLLWLTAMERGYSSMQWCTYHQVNSIDAKVRKGEKATHVIFTKHTVKKDEETGEDKASVIAKTYPVFHVSQLEGVGEQYLEPQVPDNRQLTHEKAVHLQRHCGVKVSHGANKAAYYPARDEIVLPSFGTFESEDAYIGTFAHEMIHASGHESRLNRIFGKRFADNAYAFEELVAEIGSAFTCARLGLTPSFRSASYLESWLKVLKADNRAIFSAASYAGQAADHMWNIAFPPEEQREAAE